MSHAESPAEQVTVDNVRALMAASTPHFALQLRGRLRHLIAPLPAEHPARIAGEAEIARLETLGFAGEQRGHRAEPGLAPLRSVDDPAFR
ncbi:unannotated protein [freshwater metagenome]|uniref:Unannotated protein n=1 Tax=freshwater metagenome TaxID=449393 RepID=A0A6J7J120_9ZZZZ|nr:hypothetical protein [Actinomycetota bacterium]